MALEITDNNNRKSNNSGSSGSFQQEKQTVGRSEGEYSGADPFGFGNYSITSGTQAYSPIATTIGNEEFMKLFEGFAAIVKKYEESRKGSPMEIRVLSLDRSHSPNLEFMSIVVATRSKVRPEFGVGYTVIMIEGTGGELKETQHTARDGLQYAVPVYAHQVEEANFDTEVLRLLTNSFGNDSPFFASDTIVVPRDFDTEDKVAIDALIRSAAAAANLRLACNANKGEMFKDVPLASDLKTLRQINNLSRFDPDLIFQYDFENGQKLDPFKIPRRANVVIRAVTNSGRKTSKEREFNTPHGSRVITETSGFIELMPVDFRPTSSEIYDSKHWRPEERAQLLKRVQPVFVINSMKADFGATPGSSVLCAIIASELQRGNNFISAFDNKVERLELNGYNMKNAAAITIDIPSLDDPTVSEPSIEVGRSGITEEQLLTIFGKYSHPELGLAIDVPYGAYDSWTLSIFQAASVGNIDAIRIIFRSLDFMTNNQFSATRYDGPIFIEGANMMLERGYWMHHDQRRDVAEIDYVAVCNHAEANNQPGLVKVWTDTFLDTDVEQDIRLAQRREIIQDITGRRAKFIGLAERCFFHGAFIEAAVTAFAKAEITTQSDRRGSFSLKSNRHTANFLRDAALSDRASWRQNSERSQTSRGRGGRTSWGR